MRTETPASAQRGQALLESVLALAALLVLLLAVVGVGKLMDVRHAVTGAARGLAFECAVRPRECARSDETLLDETRARHFLRDDGPVLSSGAQAARLDAATRVPAWTDRGGRPLLASLDRVAAGTSPRRLDAPTTRLDAPVLVPPMPARMLLERAGPARFGLAPRDGLHAAQVRADASAADLAARFGWAPRALGLDGAASGSAPTVSLSGRTAILVDAWAASGPDGERDDTVRARVAAGARLPGGAAAEAALDAGYAGTRLLMRIADAIRLEPAASDFEPRALRVDVVPSDRRP